MNRDYILIATIWLLAICLLIKFIPRNKLREASLLFLFMQCITWVAGLSVVEMKMIEYPVRSFPYATKASFDFEYLVFPVICVFFNIYYPKTEKSISRIMHYVYYCSGITIIELIAEKYTLTIKYINWSWYITWITLCISLYLSRKYFNWFFNREE